MQILTFDVFCLNNVPNYFLGIDLCWINRSKNLIPLKPHHLLPGPIFSFILIIREEQKPKYGLCTSIIVQNSVVEFVTETFSSVNLFNFANLQMPLW